MSEPPVSKPGTLRAVQVEVSDTLRSEAESHPDPRVRRWLRRLADALEAGLEESDEHKDDD